MISRHTVKVGCLLKFIRVGSLFQGDTATLRSFDSLNFSITFGESTVLNTYSWWRSAEWFDVIESIPNDQEYRQARKKDFFVGCKVRAADSSGAYWRYKTATLISIAEDEFSFKWNHDCNIDDFGWVGGVNNFIKFFEVLDKKRKPKKPIPDIPLDTSLPILQAGYIQDRQRKLFR